MFIRGTGSTWQRVRIEIMLQIQLPVSDKYNLLQLNGNGIYLCRWINKGKGKASITFILFKFSFDDLSSLKAAFKVANSLQED